MRKAYKKAICFFLMFIMLVGILVAPPLKVNAAVDSGQDIEVTLAVDTASNNLDLSGFSDMLKNRLMTGYSVAEDKIHINTVNTTTISSGINWYRFDHTNNSSLASNTITDKVTYYNDPYAGQTIPGTGRPNHQYQNYHISISTNQIDFYGYGVPAYKDFLYSSNSNANNKVFQFSLDESNTVYHSGEGAGFFFNASYNAVSNGRGGYTRTLSGYVVLITGTETSGDTEYITLYRLNNIDVDLFTNEASSALDNLGATEDALGLHDVSKWGTQGKVALLKRVAKTTPSSGSVRYLKLATSPTTVSFYQFTDNTYSTIKDKWLNNFTLPTVYNSFGFGPIAAYRSHSCARDTQFTFNNIAMSEDDSKTFTNIVENTTWNYPDSFRVIANMDNDGVPDFGISSDLSTILYYMMQNSAHYIGWGVNNTLSPAIGGYSTVKAQSDGFVVRNTGKGEFINRSDAGYDTLTEGVNELARYIADNMGLLMAKPVINVQYDSSFSSNRQVTVSTSNKTSLGNNISVYEWRTLDVSTNSWVPQGSSTTASLSFSSNSYNLVSLKVQDSVTGQWSDYGVAYISTDTNAPSVAMFTLDKTSFDPDTESPVITATDLSNHPAGEALTNWEWTVENETLTAQTAMARTYTNGNVPSPLTFDFSGKPGGRYTIKLRVKKGSSGTWSPYYSQNVTFFSVPGITISLSGSAGSTTATVNANVYATGGTAVTGRGIEYRIAGDSAFTRVYDSGTGPGAFFANLSSLSPGTPYEVRGFAINATGTAYDNNGVTFTTATQVPVVTGTELVGTAGTTYATVRANVTSAGESTVTARGIEYRKVTDSVYTQANTASGGIGTFSVSLSGLTPYTPYIARGYATNSFGTAYDTTGVQFVTGATLPSISGTAVSETAGGNSAVISANVISDNGSAVTARGIEYRRVTDSVYTPVTAATAGTGIFTVNLTGLSPNTGYIARGFATNGAGTAYDNVGVSFTAGAAVPGISSTALVGTAGSTTAVISANVYVSNGASVTARGIEYRSVTSSVYTAVYAQTGGIGIFTVNLTGLMQNTSYIARGFATNSVGTAYDNAGIGFSTGTQTLPQDAVSIIYAEGDSSEHVTRAVFLPSKGQSGNTTVTWSSSNTSLITKNGRVTRPEPGGADTYVTLTATLKDDTTEAETTKTFMVKVLKLTDQDAVEDAAKNLTIARAFTFAPGDTWEAITNAFLAVTAGDHGTAVSWVSDNDAIELRNESSGVAASVTRPADNNKNTILTATITRGTASVAKTFLLIVQKAGVSKTVTRQDTLRTVTAATYSNPTVQDFTIARSILDDNTKIDYVLLDTSNIQALTDEMNPLGGEGQNTVTVVMKQDSSDPAQQLAVEIPATAVAAMADRNAILEVKTDEGAIELERNVLSQMAERGTDLFFRLVPVNDAAEKKQAAISAYSNNAVIQLVGNKNLKILGIPRKIETNYTNFDTKVILPLTGITIPTTETQAFLDSLRIFVEHSDNTTELLIPLSFVYENGSPTGVEFKINRFSRFQIIRADAVSGGSPGKNSGTASKPEASIGAAVSVDGTGKDDVVSVSTTKNENGGNDTTITVINDKLSEVIKNGNASGNVTISTTDTADKLGVKLNGTLLKALQDKNDTLVIGTPAVSWSIPADAVDINSVYDALGKPSSMSDVEINITLSNLYGAQYDKIKEAIKATGAEMLSGAFDFKIDLSCNTKSVEIGKLGQYVEMSIPMPKDIDSKKITTGVYVSSKLDISHVPTKVTIADGTYYAKINSLYSSGIHTVIWNQREFSDVANHWSKEATNDMGSRTVVSGVDVGIYEPDRVITRAEFAAILAKGLGLRPVSTSNPFTDVKSDAWYGEVVKTAAAFNLIKGYEDGTFGPDKTISREEAMAMTARAMNLVKLDTNVDNAGVSEQLKKFTDGGNVAEWASQYAAACIKSGIIEGSDGTIRPKNSITRAEVAVIIRKVLKKASKI